MSEAGTVFIVDDDSAVLDALQQLFLSQGLSAEAFSNAEHYLQTVSPDRPGVLVVDVRMPGLSGLELLRQMRDAGRLRPCIVLSGHADIPIAVQAMQLGAQTFLEKPVSHRKLVEAVRAALDQEHRRQATAILQRTAEDALRSLAPEEMQVLQKIVSGRTNAQAADSLDISLRTVQLRLSAIYRKLKVRSKSELIQWLRKVDKAPVAEE